MPAAVKVSRWMRRETNFQYWNTRGTSSDMTLSCDMIHNEIFHCNLKISTPIKALSVYSLVDGSRQRLFPLFGKSQIDLHTDKMMH